MPSCCPVGVVVEPSPAGSTRRALLVVAALAAGSGLVGCDSATHAPVSDDVAARDRRLRDAAARATQDLVTAYAGVMTAYPSLAPGLLGARERHGRRLRAIALPAAALDPTGASAPPRPNAPANPDIPASPRASASPGTPASPAAALAGLAGRERANAAARRFDCQLASQAMAPLLGSLAAASLAEADLLQPGYGDFGLPRDAGPDRDPAAAASNPASARTPVTAPAHPATAAPTASSPTASPRTASPPAATASGGLLAGLAADEGARTRAAVAAALSGLLLVVHSAVYATASAGGLIDALGPAGVADRGLATSAYTDQLRLRDEITAEINAHGGVAPPAQPAYRLPAEPAGLGGALALLAAADDRLAASAHDTLAVLPASYRGLTCDALSGAAIRGQRARRAAGRSPSQASRDLPGA